MLAGRTPGTEWTLANGRSWPSAVTAFLLPIAFAPRVPPRLRVSPETTFRDGLDFMSPACRLAPVGGRGRQLFVSARPGRVPGVWLHNAEHHGPRKPGLW